MWDVSDGFTHQEGADHLYVKKAVSQIPLGGMNYHQLSTAYPCAPSWDIHFCSVKFSDESTVMRGQMIITSNNKRNTPLMLI